MSLANKRWLLALLMAVIVLGVFYWQKNSSYQATKLYEDEKYGFSVNYPTTWTAEVLNGSKIGARLPYLYFSRPKQSDPGFVPSVSIDIFSNMSFEDWVQANTIQELPNSQPKIVREFTIGIRKAFQFDTSDGDGGVSHELVVVIPPNLIVMHSLYALEDAKQAFDLMMNSFRVTK